MEGIITCLLGIASYWLLVDFPEDAVRRGFLEEKEAAFIIETIERDRADAETVPFVFKEYLACALDSKVWVFCFMFMMTTTNAYAITYFAPIILHSDMGFSLALTMCIGAAPFVAAAAYMYTQAYYSDKWHIRSPIILMNCLVGMTTLALSLAIMLC
jgi:hypothetical protein